MLCSFHCRVRYELSKFPNVPVAIRIYHDRALFLFFPAIGRFQLDVDPKPDGAKIWIFSKAAHHTNTRHKTMARREQKQTANTALRRAALSTAFYQREFYLYEGPTS